MLHRWVIGDSVLYRARLCRAGHSIVFGLFPTQHYQRRRRRLPRSSVLETSKRVPMNPLSAVTLKTIVRFPLVRLIVTYVRVGSLTVAIIAPVENKDNKAVLLLLAHSWLVLTDRNCRPKRAAALLRLQWTLSSCTADARVGPDGSVVGRDPAKDCEFVPCPVDDDDDEMTIGCNTCN
jgi:hypothetical protein